MINIPPAIGQLAFEDVTNASSLQLHTDFAAPVHEEDVIGAQRAIDDQLAAPVAVGFLLPQKVFLRTLDRPQNLFV